MDRTFVMVKPDGVQRGLVGEIVSRFEAKGLKLAAAKLESLPEERVVEQYREHLEKPFFPGLKAYIMSGPCFLMVWEGKARRGCQNDDRRHKPCRGSPAPSAAILVLISGGTPRIVPRERT